MEHNEKGIAKITVNGNVVATFPIEKVIVKKKREKAKIIGKTAFRVRAIYTAVEIKITLKRWWKIKCQKYRERRMKK